MDAPAVIAVIGGITLIIALVGGGIEAERIKIPPVPPRLRILSGLAGIVLLASVIWTSSPKPVQTSSISPIPPTSTVTQTALIPTIVQPSTTVEQATQASIIDPQSVNTTPPIMSPTAPKTVMSPVPLNTFSPSCDDPEDTELLSTGWTLSGQAGGDAQPASYQSISADTLQGKDVLQVKIDLNGASFEEGPRKDESAIIIDQPEGHWMVASVARYNIENGKDGEQIIYLPLADFEGLNNGVPDGTRLDLTHSYGPLHARFWNEAAFVVEIPSIVACNSK